MAMVDLEIEPSSPPGLHLISAFLALEPIDSLISLARKCGGGVVTESVQRFIWDRCISEDDAGKGNTRYLKNFVKKLIDEVESNHNFVLDELYEQYSYYLTSVKEDGFTEGLARVCKCISFLFPDGCRKSHGLVIPLYCSLNMLEGDTGCSVWPSSLYMSEFILSFSEILSNKSCFEIGSGVGLAGICLSYVKASKVILSDGDLSTLANMKLNLELNQLNVAEGCDKSSDMENAEAASSSSIKCVNLPWEHAKESDLRKFMPDIVLGADVIYDPLCLPHLVRVLSTLLDRKCTDESKVPHSDGSERVIKQSDCQIDHDQSGAQHNDSTTNGSKKGPLAYISTVIRNSNTFDYFLDLANRASLIVTDVTETLKPLSLFPYMQSYNRSSIRLFAVVCK